MATNKSSVFVSLEEHEFDHNTPHFLIFTLLKMKKTVHKFFQQWMRTAFISLLIVSVAGVILRYKIAFSLPFINQEYLLHAHSHFAFSGWITQALMTLLTAYLVRNSISVSIKKYRRLLLANLVTAYGMLFTFPFEGYALFSIIFSTLSIFVSYAFAVIYWRDLNKAGCSCITHKWFKAAVLCNAVSSFGAFGLAYMMATHSLHQNFYLGAIYFFLHFQYNGWFFFACMGLFSDFLLEKKVDEKKLRKVFYLFAVALVPTYLLSVLWVQLNVWLYGVVVAAAIAQVVGIILLVQMVGRSYVKIAERVSVFAKALAGLSALALIVKILLQAVSVIPSLSQLTTGFRPIVIAYLHLVFLGIITLFIIAYAIQHHYISMVKRNITGIGVFTTGIIINELLLMIQGIGALNFASVPFINGFLLVAALIMFTGLCSFAIKPFCLML